MWSAQGSSVTFLRIAHEAGRQPRQNANLLTVAGKMLLHGNNHRLPAELQDLVIQQIKHERSLLVAYGAVCRSWDNAVWPYRKLLFRCIFLKRHKFTSFHTLLRVSPRVIPCIQSLSIDCPIESAELGGTGPLDFGYLDSLPNVIELRLEAMLITPTFTSIISGFAPRVRVLEVKALYADDPLHFVRLVESFTNLQKLHIQDRPKLLPREDGANATGHLQIDGTLSAMMSMRTDVPMYVL